MATATARTQPVIHHRWRTVVVCVLTILGLISLTGFMAVHWVERQILTTDNWLAIVAPLPKNDQVASALSTYTVDQLVTSINLENKIEQVLPDRATFLAPALTDQLQTRLTKRAKQLIQSDQFTAIWTAANKAAHERIVASARGQEPPGKSNARFNLDLSGLKAKVDSLLDRSQAAGATVPAPATGDVSLGVELKTTTDKVKSVIQKTDFLNGVLGLLALVCLVGALVVTYHRRRMLMIISISIIVIALLQLIGVKAVRPAVLNTIQNSAYRPAVGVIYDTLVGNFRRAATTVLIVSALIYLAALLMRESVLNRNKWLAKQIKAWHKSTFYNGWLAVRQAVRQYRWLAAGVVVLIGLILMAFVLNLDWQGLIRSMLFVLLTIELINLVAARPRSMPMKQSA